MGCGAVSKSPTTEISAEEQALLKSADEFRLQIIQEVGMSRQVAKAKQSKDSQGTPLRSSSASQPGRFSERGEASSRSSCESGGGALRQSIGEALGPRGSNGATAANRSSLASLKSCKSTVSQLLSRGETRPLKSTTHKTRHSITEEEFIGAGQLRMTVPGKVGSQDESIAVDGAHMIMKTKKVHKHKNHAKKVYARRRLGSLDFETPDEPNQEEEAKRLADDDKKQLMKSVQRHFLFSSLSRSEQQMLLDQMVHQENSEGETICRAGEKGDACYMIISGICMAERDGRQVAQFSAGDLFGELAMLYDVPRTANVCCASPRVALGVIRGHTFRKSLALAKERTLSDTLEFLNSHKIFSKLTLDEKRMLGNALNSQTFEPGSMLIDDKISNTCEWMFLVQDGTVEVHDQFKNVKVLGAGATISGQNMPYGNHAVLAKALSHVKTMSIGYAVMNRLFGNISEVLRVSLIRSFLEPLSFFRQLTEQQQATMAGCFQEQKVNKGDIIVSALADPQLVLVIEGEVSVIDLTRNVNTSPSGRIESFKEDVAEAVATSRRSSLASKNQDKSGGFSGVMPMSTNEKADEIMESCGEPEMEVPPQESPRDDNRKPSIVSPLYEPTSPMSTARSMKEISRLKRGDLFGEESFRADGRMPFSLAARTEGIVCRAGHDEVCRALRGNSETIPSMQWIIRKNQVNKQLHAMFPFSALYDEMLDMVVESSERIEYPPSGVITRSSEDTQAFFIVVEGEAVMCTQDENSDGQMLQPMGKWASYGTLQMLLGVLCDADISAAASGCSILRITHEAFFLAAGVLVHELQVKMLHKDIKVEMEQVRSEAVLGKGQFGVVQRVYVDGILDDVHEGYALKSMSKKRIIELEQSAATKLEREILYECCHPLIVRLITTFQDEVFVHLLMETLSGGDLFTAIRDIGTLNEDHVLFYSASIILGIEYIHSRGIVYRDLKPENIMLTGEGFVKIVDFGCCTRKDRSYTFTGTPEYLAPEVILGKGYGKAVDWWSLGVIMYEMICGPLPFGESCSDPLAVMKEVLEKELDIPMRIRGDAREDLLHSLLERMPEQRLGGSSSHHWQSEVRHHAFFEDLQWDGIVEQSIVPPYSPPVTLEDASLGQPGMDMGNVNSINSLLSDDGEEDFDPPDPGSDVSCFKDF